MSGKPWNPAAFAGACTSEGYAPNYGSVNEGMLLRDYFAAHCPMTLETFLKGVKHETIKNWNTEDALASYAASRYQYADAMLKERNRE